MPQIEIKVPNIGESITEVTIVKLKAEGSWVKEGELVATIESDKISVEITAEQSGTIKQWHCKEGDEAEIGASIGVIEIVEQPGAATAQVAIAQPENQLKNSPAAEKMIAESGIEQTSISASGKAGRITKADVISHLESSNAQTLSSAPPNQPMQENLATQISQATNGQQSRSEEKVRMTKLRQRIAERLKESQNTAALLTTFNEIDMSRTIELRTEYKESFNKKHGVKLGFMSFFVKATIVALQEIPRVNASIEGNDIVYKNYYDIGIAVGTDKGLVVPVLRDAQLLSILEIESKIAEFGQKARSGSLAIEEITGGTFTISNGGVYGSLISTPIINPPQSAILGMHTIQKRPVAINDKIEIRPMMYVALSYDHRLIDGKEAVTFLCRIKECIEDPRRMLINM